MLVHAAKQVRALPRADDHARSRTPLDQAGAILRMTTAGDPRIDLVIQKSGRQFLTSPSAPGIEFDVIPENGTDKSGTTYAIRQFKAQIGDQTSSDQV